MKIHVQEKSNAQQFMLTPDYKHMNAVDLMLNRHSVRLHNIDDELFSKAVLENPLSKVFEENKIETIPDEIYKKAFRCCIKAPSACNKQPCHFYLTRDVDYIMKEYHRKNNYLHCNPSEIIICCVDSDAVYGSSKEFLEKNYYSSQIKSFKDISEKNYKDSITNESSENFSKILPKDYSKENIEKQSIDDIIKNVSENHVETSMTKYQFLDLGLAIENLLLALTHENISTCIYNAMWDMKGLEKIKERYNISKKMIIGCFIYCGKMNKYIQFLPSKREQELHLR